MNTKTGILKSSRIFVLFAFSAVVLLGQSCFAYSGGAGTADDPYQIATAGDLTTLGADVDNYDKYFILTADINLSANSFTTAVIAIGGTDEFFEAVPFTGNFNGSGHIISNLTINTDGASNCYLGLFGRIDSTGKIENLRLENVEITTSGFSTYIGGLAGWNYGDINNCSSAGNITNGEYTSIVGGLVGNNSIGSIRNCHSTVTFTSNYSSCSEIGGLVALNDEGSVINCYAAGSISGEWVEIVGGLAAVNENGTITSCYSAGDVNGLNSCGGLVGSSEGGYISDSYSTGRISGEAFLGGLVGKNRGDVNNCYSTGSVTGVIFENEVSSVGGLVGYNESGDINNCYSTGSVTGGDMASSLGGLVGMNEEGDINNCYSTGTVTGGHQTTDSGGLIGYNSGNIIDCCSTGMVSVGEDSFNIGGLTGSNLYSNISNCNFTGTVTGGSHLYDVGGLVGWNYGNVANCYSTGTVASGDDSHDIGGLVGGNEGDVNNCYSAGSVTGGSEATSLGGLVGYAIYTNISDCYSTGNVTGPNDSNQVGGLMGYNYGSNIKNCYSTGNVTGPNDSNQIGGLVGLNEDGDINSSYFLNTSGPDNGCGTSLTDAQMKQQASFVGWDFVDETVNGPNDFWVMSEGDTYPVLRAFSTEPISKYSGGTGTVNHPYQIASAADLLALAADANDYGANFILTADIDLSLYTFETAVIAGDANNADLFFSGVSFSGRFNGNGYKISNLTIKGNGSGNKYMGLFGSVQDSTIKDLRLENVKISGGNLSSGIGGLVGSDEGSVIRNCSLTGIVSGDWAIGGLVGESRDSSISNCSFIGSVMGVNVLGGLVGEYNIGIRNTTCACTDNRNGDINNCYTSGSVTGSSSNAIGGLIGFLLKQSTPVSSGSGISYCYSSCQVTAGSKSNNIGGLVGAGSRNSIYSSFFLKGSGPDNSYGEPLTAAQMKQRISFTGWDFNNTWCIFEGVSYPKFAWQWTPLQVDKCTVTAGNKPNSDKISFSGGMAPTPDDFYLTNFIQFFIDSCDMDTPYVVMIPISDDSYRKTGTFSYSGTDEYGVKKSFKFDFKTKKFSFAAQNVNLSRLSCPLSIGVDVTSFEAVTDADETIVNGSKPIPIKFLMGIKNSLRVDKSKFTRNKNTGAITKAAISGGFSVKDLNDANMAANTFDITVGSQTFTIPANSFKNTSGKSKCSKVMLKDDSSNLIGIASAVFDFNKGTFVLAIKNTAITDPKGTADFRVDFAGFNEIDDISLP